MEQITQTKSFFTVLITVCIGNAASGGTKGGTAPGETILFQDVLNPVPRHRDGGTGGEFQIFRSYGYTFFPDLGNLTGQMFQIHYHAIAQNTDYIFM